MTVSDKNTNIIKQNMKLRNEVIMLNKKLKKVNNQLSDANNKIKILEIKYDNYKKEEQKRISEIVDKAVKKVTDELNKEHKKEVDELKGKISRLEKRLNTDSTNSGIPSSKDRIGTKKIQNNREKTGGKIGAKIGHPIHKLEYFNEEEITNTMDHTLEKCPECGGDLKEINVVKSDIIDVDVKVTKTRNNIHNYRCRKCHKKVSANNKLPRAVTYGDNINAIILSMINEANTPLNKVVSFIKGITNGDVTPSEGYLAKIQKKYAKELADFNHDLKEKIISLKHVFWDDTTVKFGIEQPAEGYDSKDLEYIEKSKKEKDEKKTRNGIIRFYGNDNLALLIGHRNKNKDGIDDDGILENLGEDCVVMHDHVLLNYNDEYSFKNAECNEHIKRALKGVMDMFPEHSWAKDMRELLLEINSEKKKLIKSKVYSFSDEKIKEIDNKYDEIIKRGYQENDKVDLTYILNKNDELNLIERLDKYRENHLMFAKDFSVDFTNNTSEKGLRQVKRKLAVSFSFKNANRMKDYALIVSYLETCYRNGITRFDACKRLVGGNPYSIEEILQSKKEK